MSSTIKFLQRRFQNQNNQQQQTQDAFLNKLYDEPNMISLDINTLIITDPIVCIL